MQSISASQVAGELLMSLNKTTIFFDKLYFYRFFENLWTIEWQQTHLITKPLSFVNPHSGVLFEFHFIILLKF